MSSGDIFAGDWRDCLREQYTHVVRAQDRITEASLLSVMREVGFSESELAELRVMATMRADEMPSDFTPDLDPLQPDEPAIYPAALPESDNPQDEAPEDAPVDESVEATVEGDLAIEVEPIEAEPERDPDTPQQLNLF